MKNIKAILTLSLILSLSPLAVHAKPVSSTAPAPAATATSQQQYSDQQLKAFATAALDVDKVAQTYQPKLASASNEPAQTQKIQDEANAAMVKAIQAQGLEPEQYKEMHQNVRANPQMLEKVQAYIQAK
ncbi:MAG: DUF4168 domain-containing protein [Vampirovibrionales bacterium]|nr:DUF4168 domain-containing protein [Vampirovibrionales bacterium]